VQSVTGTGRGMQKQRNTEGGTDRLAYNVQVFVYILDTNILLRERTKIH
jgi:hypothetical protein